MKLRLAIILSCIGGLSACTSDDSSGKGAGSGAASVGLHYTSLATLKETSDLVVEGVVTSVATSPTDGTATVTMNVSKTLWAAPNVSPTTVSFKYTPDGNADHSAAVGEDLIVFLTADDTNTYYLNGGPTGAFAVTGGVVAPVAVDGVSLPEGTTVTEFNVMLALAEPAPLDPPPIYYGGGGGGGY